MPLDYWNLPHHALFSAPPLSRQDRGTPFPRQDGHTSTLSTRQGRAYPHPASPFILIPKQDVGAPPSSLDRTEGYHHPHSKQDRAPHPFLAFSPKRVHVATPRYPALPPPLLPPPPPLTRPGTGLRTRPVTGPGDTPLFGKDLRPETEVPLPFPPEKGLGIEPGEGTWDQRLRYPPVEG